MRDITLGDTFIHHFTTRQFSDGVPTTLAGTPVLSVHEEGNDTFITLGVTLDVDIGTVPVVGLNEASIVATGGNGYETGKSYAIFISTGTVGGVSVVGEVVGHFTVEKSAAAIDLANATDGLTALRTLLLDIPTVSEFNARTILAASYFDPAADDVDVRSLQASVITPASINAAAITSAKFSAGAINAAALNTDAVDEIADGVWDEPLSGHSTGGTAGKALQNAAAFIVTDGTCDAVGQTSTNVRLDSGESATDEIYTNDEIVITGGTGAGESALITAYDGTLKDATVSPALVIACDGTSTYEIVPAHAHAENLGVDAVDTTSVATGAIDADALATDAVNEIRDSILSDATTFPGASITEVRLAELAAANLPTDIANVQSDTDDIQTRLPAALVGGAMDSDVSAMQANVITAAAINAAALTAAKFAAGAIDANALAADAAQQIRDEILPTQNVAFTFHYLFVDSTDHVTPVTAAGTLAVTRSIDGAAFGAGTGTITEIANGMYEYAASAADMNGSMITFRFTAVTGTPNPPDDRFVTIPTTGAV